MQKTKDEMKAGKGSSRVAVREPSLAEREEAVPVKSGRTPKEKKELIVKRQSLRDENSPKPDGEIVRVRTGVDRLMLSLILILLALGAVMVFSASYPSALAQKGDSMHYIKRHLGFMLLGLAGMIGVSFVPISWFKKLTPLAFGVATVLLIIVLIPGIGISNGEARRWLGFGSFTFQPSEAMKVALVMMLAWYLSEFRPAVLDRQERKRYLLWGTLVPCGFVGFACILVMLGRHLSGTIIMGMIGVVVMFIGGVHMGWMGTLIGAAGILGGGVFLYANPYAWQRILTFLDKDPDKLNEAWQTTQGLLAIGSGGFLGVGLGASRQKYSYVSEAQNDFIFTIWCEEMGFVGAVVLVLLFLLFIWRGYVIAMRAPDIYSCLLVAGIVSQVGIQALLNIAVVTDVIPNTGIALPFFSYGGSSLIILLLEMGVILAVSKHSYVKK